MSDALWKCTISSGCDYTNVLPCPMHGKGLVGVRGESDPELAFWSGRASPTFS